MLEIKDYQTGKKKAEKNWKPSKYESECKRDFEDTLQAASTFRTYYEETWLECISRYEAKPFIHDDGRSGVVIPWAKIVNEQKQAVQSKSPPDFAYKPLDYSEDETIVRILDMIVRDHVWNLKYVKMDYKWDILSHNLGILGTMYQYIGWRKIYRTIRKSKAEKKESNKTEGQEKPIDDGEPNELLEAQKMEEKEYSKNTDEKSYNEEQALYYDDICVDNIMPQDVWLHPLALCVADSPWIIIRKRFDYNTFLETFSDTEFFKNIQYVQKGRWDLGSSNNQSEQYKPFATNTEKDQVVVFEKWDKMKDQLLIIANGVIIFDGPNPYDHKELPFTDFIDLLQFNTYLGESTTQRIATLSDAINAFVNIAIDKEKKSASGLNLLDSNNSDFDDVANLFTPNSAFRVADPRNAFVHIDIPGMSGSTQNMISMLIDYMVFATGVDFKQLSDFNASTKATVAAIRREIQEGRLSLNVRRNENRGMTRWGWLVAKTIQQYYPLPLVEHLGGQDKPEEGEAKVKYRNIRIKDKKFNEVPNKEGKYNASSLRLEASEDGATGFFQARPSYIRTKGDIEVRVVPDSSFSASKELEKSKAKDYLQIAASTFEVDPASGQQKPVFNVKFGAEQFAKSYGFDVQRALGEDENKDENVAQAEAAKLLGGEQTPPNPTTVTQGPPPTPTPATLTGRNSEPIQALQQQLATANNAAK